MAKQKKSRWRWLRYVWQLLAIMVGTALVLAFFFTTTVVQYLLKISPYASFSPTIEKATLHVGGGLTLQGVVLHEAGPRSHAVLLDASVVDIQFSWWGLLQRKIQQISTPDLIVYVRPGVSHPVTLQTLSYPPTMDGLAKGEVEPTPAAPTGSNSAWQIQVLRISGRLKLQEFNSPVLCPDSLPFNFDLTDTASSKSPEARYQIKLGAAAVLPADAREDQASIYPLFPGISDPQSVPMPSLTAQVRSLTVDTDQPGQAKTLWQLESFSTKDLRLAENSKFLPPQMLGTLPLEYRTTLQQALCQLGTLNATAIYTPETENFHHRFVVQFDGHAFHLQTGSPPSLQAKTAGDPILANLNLSGMFMIDLPNATEQAWTWHNNVHAQWDIAWDTLALPAAQLQASKGHITGEIKPHGKYGYVPADLKYEGLDDFKGSVTLASGQIGPWRVENLNLKAIQNTGTLKLENLSGTFGQGTFQGRGQFNLRNPTEYDAEISLQNIQAQALVAALVPQNLLDTRSITGTLSAQGAYRHTAHKPPEAILIIPSTKLAMDAAALRKTLPMLSTGGEATGKIELKLAGLDLNAQDLSTNATSNPNYAATFSLKGLSINTPEEQTNPLRLENFNLNLAGQWQTTSPSTPQPKVFNMSGLSLNAGNQLSLSNLQIGKFKLSNLTSRIQTTGQNLVVNDFGFNLFGGVFRAELQVPLANPDQLTAKLVIAKLDQHELFLALNPEKVDGQGSFSGLMSVALTSEPGIPIFTLANAPPTNLRINLDLRNDNPGRIMIKDEQTARQLASGLPPTALELLPENYPDIVVGQLKNYPYTEGVIQLNTSEGHPSLNLQFHRPPLTPGEPGYGVKKVIQGQSIVASYPIQLSSVNVEMSNETLVKLLELMLNPTRTVLPDSPKPSP